MERRFDAEVEAEVVQTAKGQTLSQIAKGMLESIDPDVIEAKAKEGRPLYHQPSESELRALRDPVVKSALAPLATNPDLRNLLKRIQKAADQTIDIISRDNPIHAGPAQKAFADQLAPPAR